MRLRFTVFRLPRKKGGAIQVNGLKSQVAYLVQQILTILVFGKNCTANRKYEEARTQSDGQAGHYGTQSLHYRARKFKRILANT